MLLLLETETEEIDRQSRSIAIDGCSYMTALHPAPSSEMHGPALHCSRVGHVHWSRLRTGLQQVLADQGGGVCRPGRGSESCSIPGSMSPESQDSLSYILPFISRLPHVAAGSTSEEGFEAFQFPPRRNLRSRLDTGLESHEGKSAVPCRAHPSVRLKRQGGGVGDTRRNGAEMVEAKSGRGLLSGAVCLKIPLTLPASSSPLHVSSSTSSMLSYTLVSEV